MIICILKYKLNLEMSCLDTPFCAQQPKVDIACAHTTKWNTNDYLEWIGLDCPINTSVVELKIFSNNNYTLSPYIDRLPNLQTLHLTGNLGYVPPEIGKLINLKFLGILL